MAFHQHLLFGMNDRVNPSFVTTPDLEDRSQ